MKNKIEIEIPLEIVIFNNNIEFIELLIKYPFKHALL